MWLEILGLIIILATTLHVWVRCGRVGKYLAKLPGPYAWPVVGNALDFVGNFDNIWPLTISNNRKYGPVYKVWAPHWAIVNVLHPDDIEILLSSSKHIEKSVIYDFLHRWLRRGLLTSTGAKWQERRKILTPAFHFNILQKYMEILVEHGTKMVDSIKSEDKPVTLNLGQFITKYTLSTICETAMGTPLIDSSTEAEKYRAAVHTVGEKILIRWFRLWPVPDWIYYNLIPTGIEEKKAIKILHDFSIKIIQERKLYHRKTEGKYLIRAQTNDTDDCIYSSKFKKRRLAMLDHLIAAENDGLIDDNGILDEVNTFIFEGNDTTSAGLTYVLQLLAEFSDVQERVRKEVDEIWDTCNGKFTISDINKLVFLERCIKESLRLFPSVPFISRTLREDLQLTNHLLPKGILVQLLIYDLHRDERLWTNPHEFNPDRFLPENCVNRHPFQYIPFSAGPRNCIGQKFAMLEIKTFCAYILRHFRLEAQRTCMQFEIKPDLVMRPQKPFYVKFTPIKEGFCTRL